MSQQPDIRLRDPEVRRRTRPTKQLDVRHEGSLHRGSGRASRKDRVVLNASLTSPQLFGNTDVQDTGVLAKAHATTRRAWLNRDAQRQPDLRRELNTEANAMVHQFTRETKAEVLQLMRAAKAGTTESKALLRCYRLLERAVEEPDRMLWIVDQTTLKRKSRPLHGRDEVDDLLAAEKASARRCKRLLIRKYAECKSTTREMKRKREVLGELIKDKRIGLGLNADAYSGAVEGAAFPLPLDWGPPCVQDLGQCYTQSVLLRQEVEASLAQCSAEMAACRAATEAAIKDSIRKGKELHREVMMAKAETRLADAQARRNQHTLEITRLKHLGPEASTDRTVAERTNRPVVATYGRATGHSFGGVTAMETAKLAEEWLSDNIRQTKYDRDALAVSNAKLDAAIHDVTKTTQSDIALRNYRTRFGPGRRLGGNV